jgi:hypothetical protein
MMALQSHPFDTSHYNARLPRKGKTVTNFQQLLGLSSEQFSKTDPLEMNLLVAKSIPRWRTSISAITN